MSGRHLAVSFGGAAAGLFAVSQGLKLKRSSDVRRRDWTASEGTVVSSTILYRPSRWPFLSGTFLEIDFQFPKGDLKGQEKNSERECQLSEAAKPNCGGDCSAETELKTKTGTHLLESASTRRNSSLEKMDKDKAKDLAAYTSEFGNHGRKGTPSVDGSHCGECGGCGSAPSAAVSSQGCPSVGQGKSTISATTEFFEGRNSFRLTRDLFPSSDVFVKIEDPGVNRIWKQNSPGVKVLVRHSRENPEREGEAEAVFVGGEPFFEFRDRLGIKLAAAGGALSGFSLLKILLMMARNAR
uniref:Uncharacterized protein n=1 Tax=Chromera velia CCMP2878 TaxID=1169474 RepID=A0A0G4FN96_9ALVE|eukprot:Cvel_17929.t1-p1 / transcript=Cvel_17929.t1 / gene=Cvel_17929 / organism=Chromera_velia_CCMP2878 / gene_product=hypothetical protein / transcript_product=hypothetical protein / location=Cvel_scaffold1457:22943-24539(+) / protein_length=296 / sequence_SO=supercontig / SO=protein_coding / is_pseudo=false